MRYQCKHPYAAKWHHSDKHCPNLAPNAVDLHLYHYTTDTVPVMVKYDPPVNYTSLAHFWTDWYQQYLDADYPRLLVRFEDLQFHAKEMIDKICQCAGAVPREEGKFTYIVDSGKWGPGTFQLESGLILRISLLETRACFH